MIKLFAGIFALIYSVAAPADAAEVYTAVCENCDYVAEDIVIGFSDTGEIVSIGLCPDCKELFEVALEMGDLEGKKKYKCPLCRERLYLYRAVNGDPLTEPGTEERYQCPKCGDYGLALKEEVVKEEEKVVDWVEDDTPDP